MVEEQRSCIMQERGWGGRGGGGESEVGGGAQRRIITNETGEGFETQSTLQHKFKKKTGTPATLHPVVKYLLSTVTFLLGVQGEGVGGAFQAECPAAVCRRGGQALALHIHRNAFLRICTEHFVVSVSFCATPNI